jgi:ABC transporter substrate binding protein
MRRRDFITLIGGAVGVWPSAAHAQTGFSIIGYIGTGSANGSRELLAAFHRGLHEMGYVQDQNIRIEYRWAEGEYNKLAAFAAELVQRQVTALVTTGGSPAALAAKAVTTKIPIIFSTGNDPIETGVVSTLNRPGGNITGATFLTSLHGVLPLDILRNITRAPISTLPLPHIRTTCAQCLCPNSGSRPGLLNSC